MAGDQSRATRTKVNGMIRILCATSLLILGGCVDQSKGAALNACRQKYFLDDPAVQGQVIPDCMAARSFQMLAACNPAPDEYEWDWRVTAFPYDNPACYQGMRSDVRIASFFSPM